MERIKFTTSFPRDFHNDIVSAIDEHDNLCNWVHLPVQSGSDRVLRAMRRGHTTSDYLKRIEAIKNSRRRMAITSDIIVGFPGETEGDFQETMNLVKQVGYDGLYIFNYSERPGTPAAKLKDNVTRAEKTARFLALEELQKEIQQRIYQDYIGRETSVLIEKRSSKAKQDMTGHSPCHKVVNFPARFAAPGQIGRVRITEAKPNSLYGELLWAA
jgi:tRNA-2-methylthio-N6-dimethylallyladenosine synthase